MPRAYQFKAYMSLALNSYFEKPVPKSLDRNEFDIICLDGLLPEDGAATLVHFTATSIARSVGHLPCRFSTSSGAAVVTTRR